jgi:pimeloyl-ACP methyl ester carboxylesterase
MQPAPSAALFFAMPPPPKEVPMAATGPAPATAESIPGLDRAGYPFRSRFLEVPAGRMHYVDLGPADGGRGTLLFVHGTPTWSFEWRHLLRALSAEWRCIAPDQIGFGLSERPRDFSYAPEDHARNLLAFVRSLDLRGLTLVVHDYGGPIGLPIALEEPARIAKVVVVNTWMWSFEGDKEMEQKAKVAGGAVGRFLYRYGNFSLRVLTPYAYGDKRKLTPAIHKQYLDRFPDTWSRGAVLWPLAKALLGSSAFYRGLWEKRECLRAKPALIVWGLKDRAFGPRLLARWKVALPEARVSELPDSGHWPHEEEPEKVIRALRDFLAA